MANIRGTSGNDSLFGFVEDDLIVPLGGDDFVDGGAGNDIVVVQHTNRGSLGSFTPLAIERSPVFNQGIRVTADGVDTLINVEQVTAVGNNTNEIFIVDADISTEISALGGNDLIRLASESSNTVDGGSGVDTLELRPVSSALNISFSSNGSVIRTVGVASGASDDYTNSIRNIEEIEVRDSRNGNLSRNNVLTFSSFSGETTLEGGGGRDLIFGGSNSDELDGGDGNDFLNGGLGDDLYKGGSGNDTAAIRATGRVSFTANSIISSDGVDRFENIEKVTISGSSADQVIVPGLFDIAVDVRASGGDDIVFGTDKRDTLDGGSGNDRLFGLTGNDVIRGGQGNDFMNGGFGSDSFSSGSTLDRDTFFFGSIREGGDFIRDFDTFGSLSDGIQVNDSGFAPTASGISRLSRGELPTERLVLGSASLGSNAGFRYIQSNGQLLFDGNGGGRDSGEQLLVTLRFGSGFSSSPVAFSGLADSITVV